MNLKYKQKAINTDIEIIFIYREIKITVIRMYIIFFKLENRIEKQKGLTKKVFNVDVILNTQHKAVHNL